MCTAALTLIERLVVRQAALLDRPEEGELHTKALLSRQLRMRSGAFTGRRML